METQAAVIRPPSSNRGANWHTCDRNDRFREGLTDSPADLLHWDWYQATLTDSPDLDLVHRVLSWGCGGGSWEPVPGLYGYLAGNKLSGVEVGSVQVFSRPGDIHVQATSEAAVPVARVLREVWPDHRVSRADVAFDVDEPGAFDRLWKQVHALARDGAQAGGRKVTTSTAGDWLDGEQGRTLYAGGKSSRLRVVVYEKGHEQLGKDPSCQASKNWARVEWRVRPGTPQAKAWLGRATPVEALGFTPFGALVAANLLDHVVSTPDVVRRFASQDPMYWMVRQYRAAVVELLGMDPLDAMTRLAALVDAAQVQNT